jgi:hypothetical protein
MCCHALFELLGDHGTREDLDLFHRYMSFRDSVSTPINTGDSACPENPSHEGFYALTQLFCQEMSGKTPEIRSNNAASSRTI